jgi:glycosyltransferase involved in cell wall biosynthesis
LLAAHDIGLLSSRVEGWGLVLNEMLEAGMIVYSTQVGGYSDLGPHFPRQLRAFPPPTSEPISLEVDVLDNLYIERFSWPSIARSYAAHLENWVCEVGRS